MRSSCCVRGCQTFLLHCLSPPWLVYKWVQRRTLLNMIFIRKKWWSILDLVEIRERDIWHFCWLRYVTLIEENYRKKVYTVCRFALVTTRDWTWSNLVPRSSHLPAKHPGNEVEQDPEHRCNKKKILMLKVSCPFSQYKNAIVGYKPVKSTWNSNFRHVQLC